MLTATSKQFRLSGLLLGLLFLFGLAVNAAALDSAQGYIMEVLGNGDLRLEEGLLVKQIPATSVVQGVEPYAGRLLVGMEARITGELDSAAGILEAREVSVLTALEPEAAVEGSAVVEERRQGSDQIVLLADGRRLLISNSIRLSPPDLKNLEALPQLDEIEPGMFVHYRGRLTPDGATRVEELAAWRNHLEEKEKELYEQYQPDMLLPARAGAGPAVLRIDKNRYPVVKNTELQLFADRLGTRLLPAFWRDPEAARRHGYNFWFMVVVHDRPQASAFPSGVVVIHTGLLRLAENEAQLAFVLAHEIAHVTQEHAWREYLYHRRKLLFLRWSTAGLGYAVESAIRRGYRRDLEEQADRLALAYMSRAGYDPREGLKILRRLEQNQEGLSALLWETHPGYGQRRSALMKELTRYSAAGLNYGRLSRDSPEFVSFREKIPTRRIKKASVVD